MQSFFRVFEGITTRSDRWLGIDINNRRISFYLNGSTVRINSIFRNCRVDRIINDTAYIPLVRMWGGKYFEGRINGDEVKSLKTGQYVDVQVAELKTERGFLKNKPLVLLKVLNPD
ncbi:hypothetical protein A2526_05795 [candidate division WOR-1 bacterium RIFOXYD2_FULL_36_8]|uniref:Uncharacterized protein n=1 Tax=candidate division WOR-1 bacterium RIFOXYB2_FULL_36_35 TaxID=1802578 RepID=A0A1F4S0X0_UNCSA|nr:MAG: hypothetical protein A2230_07735 [candidate division WOR-1 bacterium RIFOXYA2_FULL_36_21]OGC13383.1 MAG: hypothetical protein A2290_02645 [candidate division WOR-1 bacterium RIFOXYB2_FULL_36_35]OGC21245.1 MAG: hypothetical protein A2282_01825 [candidate division WOR-1 bacterium RIFOXYA12_FULL_36_13]OGC41504.1 MAG: hypothetical protein A2526_05795 [candidate division WOR-1 bacterium RIFOXYD2_FULL_36_8]